MSYGIVAIGRNEGIRFQRCLKSLPTSAVVIYVDSGSTDDSIRHARQRGAFVVELNDDVPFTAARARNAGYRQLKSLMPDLDYVQFIDGDCELVPGWIEHALSFLASRSDVAAAAGSNREKYPDASLYNELCDHEWGRQVGTVDSVGGNAIFRTAAFDAVGGFNDGLIAGEEPELCYRLRCAGWKIARTDHGMTLHDADIKTFRQWWRRMMRSGYAYANAAYLHGMEPARFRVRECARIWLWAAVLPLLMLASLAMFGAIGLAWLLLFPAQVLRQTMREKGALRTRFLVSFFQTLARFPELFGQIRFFSHLIHNRRAAIIEYK